MSIIYEVNIKVSLDILDDYLSWLDKHISEILDFDGFESAKIYKENVTSLDFFALTIHYSVSSKTALDSYFSNHAEIMRQKGVDRFGDNFSATRRILEQIN
tara:strand:- start:733 stop:1035 length:303 start_codon:yes stop_codon:yes gene_type:complete